MEWMRGMAGQGVCVAATARHGSDVEQFDIGEGDDWRWRGVKGNTVAGLWVLV